MSGRWIDGKTYEEDCDPVNDYATGPVVGGFVTQNQLDELNSLIVELRVERAEVLEALRPFVQGSSSACERAAAVFFKLGGKL